MKDTYLSYSTAAELITRSPAHALLRKTAPKEPPTAAQIKGTAVHELILGVSAGSQIVMIDCDNYRKKEHQEMRDAALAAGKTPLTVPQLLDLTTAAEEIKKNIAALGVQLTGESEASLEWEERTRSGLAVKCRRKLDHLAGSDIYELKSTSNASLDQIQKQIYAMAYDIQFAAYTSGLRITRPAVAGREKFTFIFFEIEPPYSVTPVTLNGEFRHIGQARWQRAVDAWAECLASGTWPHYAHSVVDIAPPKWAVIREDEMLDREFDEEARA